MDDHLGPFRLEQMLHARGISQIVLTAAGYKDACATSRVELVHNVRAQKAGASGHDHAFVFEFNHECLRWSVPRQTLIFRFQWLGPDLIRWKHRCPLLPRRFF
jgi:hypothetical protein